ncbi:MAG: FAD-dependent oxidoreductase [Bdellovibrionales bacterium]|nr:FAD-dependent oxidoreductase [Bdellovibrionales bacterium]
MKDAPLFRPLKLGAIAVKNRFVMGAIHTGLESRPEWRNRLLEFYRARAEAGVGLIFTGGFSPSLSGMKAAAPFDVEGHSLLTKAVHQYDTKICLQILHAGRYLTDRRAVAPSPLRAPISPIRPRALEHQEIADLIEDYGRLAQQAIAAGYDGVEINGAEGFLVSQFLARRTNQRDDHWGGCYENRCRFAVSLVREVRGRLAADKILSFRISLMDLVQQGSSWSETLRLARLLEAEGVTVFNTAVGWNESRVPTTSGVVPRAAFAGAAKRLKEAVGIPAIAGGRINTVESAESMLTSGACDMVSMARAFLAAPKFIEKAAAEKRNSINTCIACNQTCLDRSFAYSESVVVSCLVNPWACHETVMPPLKIAKHSESIAVVGAGPAGLSAAITLAERGHRITVFDSQSEIGGQFLLACRVPGKTEYAETLRYYTDRVESLGIGLRLGVSATAELLREYAHVFLATGTTPRSLSIPGCDGRVLSFYDAFAHPERVGKRVAIVGAGAVAFDTAEFLSHRPLKVESEISSYFEQWQTEPMSELPGQLLGDGPRAHLGCREIHILQRRPGIVGGQLGRTTGWIKRDILMSRGVRFHSGVVPMSWGRDGLRVRQGGSERVIDVDTVVVCIGSEPRTDLAKALGAKGISHSFIGAAQSSLGAVDAEAAIRNGTESALRFESSVENE